MRAAFVGHSYHLQTRSADFFKDYLTTLGYQLDEYLDASWSGGGSVDVDAIVTGEYERVFVWQIELLALSLSRRLPQGCLIFVPMYDGCAELGDEYWRAFAPGSRILTFCRALHERLQPLGVLSCYTQYFPDPAAFSVIDPQSTIRLFLWQRRAELGWKKLKLLLGDAIPDRIHLHLALDPGFGIAERPSEEEADRYPITESSWFETQDDLVALLDDFNVYVAPRLREGIGMSFLEAMAKGQCVVAADRPTMSEYITNGANGLLFDPDKPAALDFSSIRELGARARYSIEQGHRRWTSDRDGRVADFLSSRDNSQQTKFRARSLARWQAETAFDFWKDRNNQIHSWAAVERQHSYLRSLHAARQAALAEHRELEPDADPILTIAIVTYNAQSSLGATLFSILSQDCLDFETILVDGGSTDGTGAHIARISDLLDNVLVEPDLGPYDAMNKAAKLATGQYILYINAGDWLYEPDTLSRILLELEEEADLVVGHHIYLDNRNTWKLHKASLFGQTFRKLSEGDIDFAWLSGVPCHQSTVTRTSLVREHGYDLHLRIAADHEFMYRMAARGAVFQHVDFPIGVYTAGGLSAVNTRRCEFEWWRIARQYGPSEPIDLFFKTQISPCIGWEPADRQRIRQEIIESGLFFADWYRARFMAGVPLHIDPVEHYLANGVPNGTNPGPFFDTLYYDAANPDAALLGLNPLVHYIRHGQHDRRWTMDWNDPWNPSRAALRLFDPDHQTIGDLIARARTEPVRHLLSLWTERAADVD